jgi:hypothetical protein
MSVDHISAVFKFSKMKMTARFVLVCLADFAGADGRCWPSIKTIARRCAMTERAVQNAIKDLIALGELRKEREGGFIDGKNISNTYRIILRGECGSPGEGDSPGAHHTLPGVNKVHHRGERRDIDGVNHVHPNRHIEPSIEPSARNHSLGSSATASITAEKKTRSPTLGDFTEYGLSKGISDKDCKDQYEIWDAAEWHDGNNRPIDRWKSKLLNFQKMGNLPSDKRKRADSQFQNNGATKKHDPRRVNL